MLNFFVQDGTIDKNDLRGAFDNVGVLMTESELDELLGEVKIWLFKHRRGRLFILFKKFQLSMPDSFKIPHIGR